MPGFHTMPGDYSQAANLFATASIAMRTSAGDVLGSAEMDNNRSVALLKAGNAKAALSASQGTEILFSQAGDLQASSNGAWKPGCGFRGIR